MVVDLDPGRAAVAIEVFDDIEEEGRLSRRGEVARSAGLAVAYEWLGAVDGLRHLLDGGPPTP